MKGDTFYHRGERGRGRCYPHKIVGSILSWEIRLASAATKKEDIRDPRGNVGSAAKRLTPFGSVRREQDGVYLSWSTKRIPEGFRRLLLMVATHNMEVVGNRGAVVAVARVRSYCAFDRIWRRRRQDFVK